MHLVHGSEKKVFLQTTFILLVLAAVTFFVFPDRTIDPWDMINLRRVGKMILIIASIEFGGYLVERLAGQRIGILATGFFGGLASSTAVFLSMARTSKLETGTARPVVSACLMAISANLLLFLLIVYSVEVSLFFELGKVAGLAAAISFVVALFTGFRGKIESSEDGSASRSPVDFLGVLRLSFFILVLLAATASVKNQFGSQGVGIFSFISGLFELHGLALANSTLYVSGKLSGSATVYSLYTALIASFISKLFICWALGSRAFASAMTLAIGMIVALAAGAGLVF